MVSLFSSIVTFSQGISLDNSKYFVILLTFYRKRHMVKQNIYEQNVECSLGNTDETGGR